MATAGRIARIGGLFSVVALVASVLGCAPTAQSVATPSRPAASPATPAPPARAASPTATPVQSQAPAPAPPKAAPAPVPAPAAVKRGGTLRLIASHEPPHWDPHREVGEVEMWQYLGNFLINFNPTDGSPVPELVESWSFRDPTTLVLSIRKGVRFHNLPPVSGREMTADDIIWNLERVRRPGPLYIWRSNLEPVDSLNAPDKYTVVVRLKAPFAPIVSYLKGGTNPVQPVLAREVEEKLGGEDAYKKLENARGTGPFMIKSHTPGVGALAVRNPDFWQPGTPYLDAVSAYFVPDVATMLAAYRTGKVDFTASTGAVLDIDAKRSLERTSPDIKFTVAPNPSVMALVPNVTRKPFDDVRLRKAIFLALDRQEMIEAGLGGGGHLSGPMSPKLFPGWTWSETDLLKREGFRPKGTPEGLRDLAEAQEIVQQLGYGPNRPFVVEAEGCQCVPSTNLTPMEIAKSQLRKIWIEISIKMVDRAQWFDQDAKGQFLFRSRAYGVALEPDAQLYSRHRTSAGRNFQRFSDPVLDNLLEQQRRELDVAKRKQLVLQAQERLWSLYPQMWFAVKDAYITQQPWVMTSPTVWQRWGDPARTWINR